MRSLLFAILTICSLMSCASIPSKNLNAKTFNLNEDEGAIAGVVGLLKKSFSSSSNIYYTNDEIEELIAEDKYNKRKFAVNIATGAAAPSLVADFSKDKDDPYVYFFFVVKEKPGNYRFNEYTFFFNSGYIQELIGYPIQQDLEFNIEKGKIKYFGTMFLDSRTRSLIYTDRFKEADLEKFKEKLPHINISE